jgi:hypothetical protein
MWAYSHGATATCRDALRTQRHQPQVKPPAVAGATYGQTSITHYEYLRAVERKIPVMAFLLDEQYPWPPHLIDGFDTTRPQAPANAADIRKLKGSAFPHANWIS